MILWLPYVSLVLLCSFAAMTLKHLMNGLQHVASTPKAIGIRQSIQLAYRYSAYTGPTPPTCCLTVHSFIVVQTSTEQVRSLYLCKLYYFCKVSYLHKGRRTVQFGAGRPWVHAVRSSRDNLWIEPRSSRGSVELRLQNIKAGAQNWYQNFAVEHKLPKTVVVEWAYRARY